MSTFTSAGGLDLASLQTALRADFDPEVASQINRPIVLPKLLKSIPCTNVVQWDIRTGTARPTTAVLADGNSVANFNGDTFAKATLYPGSYQDAFKVSRKAIIGARLSGNPDALRDLFAERLMEAAERLGYAIAYDVYNGTGATSDNMLGLIYSAGSSSGDINGGLCPVGTYAGLARATYTQFVPTYLTNSPAGTTRELTVPILYDFEESIYKACGRSPDLYVAGTKQFKKYAETFGTARRYVSEVTLAGPGTIKLDAGVKALEFSNAIMVRDATLSDDRILAIDTSSVFMRYMPDPDATVDLTGTYEAQTGQGSMGIKAAIRVLPADGDFVSVGIWAYPQVQVKYPFRCGQLVDLA